MLVLLLSHSRGLCPGGTGSPGRVARRDDPGERTNALDVPQSAPTVGFYDRYDYKLCHELRTVGKNALNSDEKVSLLDSEAIQLPS